MTPARPFGLLLAAHAAGLALAAALSSACDAAPSSPDAAPPDAPSLPPPCSEHPADGVWGLFGNPSTPARSFRVLLTGSKAVAGALDYWVSPSATAIPIGPLRCRAPVGWNCGWRWYLEPSRTEFVESAMELCDAAPPQTDAQCDALVEMTGGLWCPWNTRLLELRDCRTDPTCPVVPR